MTIHERQALWVQTHGTPAQAERATIYIRHQTATTRQALSVLFRRVCEGR
jgi:hypothetical protein